VYPTHIRLSCGQQVLRGKLYAICLHVQDDQQLKQHPVLQHAADGTRQLVTMLENEENDIYARNRGQRFWTGLARETSRSICGETRQVNMSSRTKGHGVVDT